ncbi:hypothetical protein R6Q57_018776 [Mikania cordata]
MDYKKSYKLQELMRKFKFIAPIAMVEFHQKLKMPSNIGKYNGLTDPEDHYNVFLASVEHHQLLRFGSKVQATLHSDEALEEVIVRYNMENLQISGTTVDL